MTFLDVALFSVIVGTFSFVAGAAWAGRKVGHAIRRELAAGQLTTDQADRLLASVREVRQ